jgi:16S rRNA (uracil1498-N3)-methyltransferase
VPERYFVETPITADHVLLGGGEAHHLIHVMRAKPGVEVVLFDGSGAEFPARVERVARAEVELAVLGRADVDRESPLDVTLGVALPKGDRQRWLVEKATELGVRRLVPLRLDRSVAQPTEAALSRLRRTVVEASKQCGRNRLMTVTPPQQWVDFLAEAADTSCRLLAHPGGADLGTALTGRCEGPIRLAIGPEGGLTAEELAAAADAAWQLVDLGRRILRVETAAIFLTAALLTPPRPADR